VKYTPVISRGVNFTGVENTVDCQECKSVVDSYRVWACAKERPQIDRPEAQKFGDRTLQVNSENSLDGEAVFVYSKTAYSL
jgi:hypothetical protein